MNNVPVDGDLKDRGWPCGKFPWRVDTNLAEFSDADFTKLQAANGCGGAEASVTAPIRACHLDQRDTLYPMRLCARCLPSMGFVGPASSQILLTCPEPPAPCP
jgi:hypothetical protein